MGKLVIVMVFLSLILWGFFMLKGDRLPEQLVKSSEKILPDSNPQASPSKVQITSRSLFVPYWNVENLKNTSSEYDRLIYFGISVK